MNSEKIQIPQVQISSTLNTIVAHKSLHLFEHMPLCSRFVGRMHIYKNNEEPSLR